MMNPIMPNAAARTINATVPCHKGAPLADIGTVISTDDNIVVMWRCSVAPSACDQLRGDKHLKVPVIHRGYYNVFAGVFSLFTHTKEEGKREKQSGIIQDIHKAVALFETMEGFLQKRAVRSGRSWKRRYFVLSDLVLTYYKTDDTKQEKPRGEFPVTALTTVRPSSAREFGMEMASPDGLVLTLAAESIEEQHAWLDAINKSIEVAKRQPAPLDTSVGLDPIPPSADGEDSNKLGMLPGANLIKRLTGGVRPRRSSSSAAEEPGLVQFPAGGTTFEVDSRYSFIRSIGHGAYGVVVSAHDKKGEKGEKVAIKKVSKAFDDLVDAKRILREIKLLRHFDHENLIHIRDLMVTNAETGLGGFNDIYIVSELMETDLHRVIYSRQALSEDHIQYFVYQILRALKYIHSASVVHRDLKPSNLLLNSTCDLKVCDFGLARGLQDIQLQLTEYVVTRWYRAPEIMLACREYTLAIDIWSVGCIFAEMLGRKPLFPGEDYLHQLRLISETVGTPGEGDLHFVTSEKALKFMRGLVIKPRADLSKAYPKANKDALDLLDKMLKFDPKKRITVVDALQHPYLATLHHPDDEPVCESLFEMRDDVPDDDLKKKDIQVAILEEVFKLRPELERQWLPHLAA